MKEHIFQLTDINPLELYGSNNLRLTQIEKGFPDVRFIARGDELKVSGEADKIERLSEVLSAIFDEIRKRGRISDLRFQEILTPQNLNTQQATDIPPQINDSDIILYGNSGFMIKPKTSGQRELVKQISENDICFALGLAGTGKTYIAVAMAVKALKEKRVKKIILSRPAVDAGESLGFLPGDMKEKVDPYLRPIYDALEDMIHSEKLKYYLQQNVIEIAPLAFMRGRTLSNAFVILDEAQNVTEMQMRMFLTRLGENSKMVITGDETQIDLPPRTRSGLRHAVRLLSNVKGIGMMRMKATDVVRHKLVRDILAAYEKDDAQKDM